MELKDRTIDDCKRCIWKHVDGYCTSWDCDFVSREEAREAIEYVRGERDGQTVK